MGTVVLFGTEIGPTLSSWAPDLAKSAGVPALIAVIVLTQLQPKIDRGIAIADHVDAELQYLAIRGCSPVGNFPSSSEVVSLTP